MKNPQKKSPAGFMFAPKILIPFAALVGISCVSYARSRTMVECERPLTRAYIPQPGKAAVMQALAFAERDQYLSNKGDFEAMSRTLEIWNKQNFCNGASVVVVGGTNSGQSSYNILSSCPELSFYGFEIQKKYYESAKSNLSQFPRVTLLNMGWSDVAQSEVGIGGKGETGGLYDPRGQHRFKLTNLTVSTVRLSDWARSNLRATNFLYVLIDVEGHEPKAIRGMELEEVQNRKRFAMFQYELGGTWAGLDNRHGGQDEWNQFETAKYLEDFGYSLFLLGTKDLLFIDAAFFREDGNIAMDDEGYGKFIQGNLLAIHTDFAAKPIVDALYATCRTNI